MEDVLINKEGEKVILLGNDAIVRGALEAGVDFVSTYPGTPASEIGNTFYHLQKEIKKINPNFYFEFSTNEKVALEAGAGAALSGQRALVAFKHFGLNVASDFLLTLMYTGVRGGMVIYVADDPSCWSSAQSEQNSRFFYPMAHIPTLEPSTPQEFKDFTKIAFNLSEKFKIPFLIRSTTRAAHQSGITILNKFPESKKESFNFIKDKNQFVTMSPRVLEMKKELLKKIEKIQKLFEKNPINRICTGPTRANTGIITSGISYLYVKESLEELNLNLPILKLASIYPLPEKKIKTFLQGFKKVLVVEEMEPYLEQEIKILAKDVNPRLQVLGKENGPIEGGRIWRERKNLLPEIGELKPEYVILALSRITGKKPKIDLQEHLKMFLKVNTPSRPPILCPGCPYWFVISAIKKNVPLDKIIFGGEIGCYMLFNHPAINLQDYLYCMGSTVSVAHGITKATGKKVITFSGDSSFFHAGIPALINTVFNKSNPLIIILNNQTTAMTGHQPHPGVGKKSKENGVEAIEIENIVKACGVKNVRKINQISEFKEFEMTLKEFLAKDEVSVIIATAPCIFVKNN